MSTYIVLEDGRVLALSNGRFDGLLEASVEELTGLQEAVPGLRDWFLDQRCEVQGPGIGYLDLRELAPVVRTQFRICCERLYGRASGLPNWLSETLLTLVAMWSSIDRGEPPEALTSPQHKLHPAGEPRGPGW